jgi:uncharacterized protein
MPSIYDIYERKNYHNRFLLPQSVSFQIEVRETDLQIHAQANLTAKAKDSVFRYRYQIEEYLRQHPAFREAGSPIQIYASAPEIIRFADLAARCTEIAPMACMSGAIADFVGRDLGGDSPNLIVSSGGDAFVRVNCPLDVCLYAQGSPLHEKLVLALPLLKRPFGISTYVPGRGIHAVTVISRSACWASAFSRDIGNRLLAGENPDAVLDRVAKYQDVAGVILIAGNKICLGGDLVLKSADGKEG